MLGLTIAVRFEKACVVSEATAVFHDERLAGQATIEARQTSRTK
jgi:hypothetical protein